jgi:hypothetical protein
MKRLRKPIAQFISEMSHPAQQATSKAKWHCSIRGCVQSGAHPCFLADSMGPEHWLLKPLHTASYSYLGAW